MKKRPTCGVIVGRFQVDTLHDGHLHLIESVMARHEKVIIVLGLAPVRVSRVNPLDFSSRKAMINEVFPDVLVLYLKDVVDDAVWSRNLDTVLHDHTGPDMPAVLYGSRQSFIRYYTGRYPTQEIEQETFSSGEEVRRRISATCRNSPDFRAGVVWAAFNQYPKVWPTVDVAIFSDDCTRLLMAKKEHETHHRFVGGFVNVGENLETAARREVKEEAHLEITPPMYVGSLVVDDWRYRQEHDKIMTTLFEVKICFGIPTPDDDIRSLTWVTVEALKSDPMMVVPEHRPLLQMLLNGSRILQEAAATTPPTTGLEYPALPPID